MTGQMNIPMPEKTVDIPIIGITGRSGSGKSSVAAHYAARGYAVADGDVISREVTGPGSPCLAALAAAFGEDILTDDGALDRKALGERAFKDKASNQRLIAITHPPIVQRMLELAGEAERQGAPLFFLDGAMIVGGPVQPYCDKIILVVAEQRLSVSRIILRDGISKMAARRRLDAQLPEATLRAAADYVIENSDSLGALQQRADRVLDALLRYAEEKESEKPKDNGKTQTVD